MVVGAKVYFEGFDLVNHASFLDLAPVLLPEEDLIGSFCLSVVLVADRRESERLRGGECPTGIVSSRYTTRNKLGLTMLVS